MFLAHFSNTPLNVLLEWPAADIVYWHTEAVKQHNKINKAPE